MSNCLLEIKIDDYGPKNLPELPFDNFECHFIFDKSEDKINMGTSPLPTLTKRFLSVKKELRFIIKLINTVDSTLLGVSDFTIPYSMIKKKSKFSYNKKCSLLTLDSVKRSLFGKILGCPQIFISITADVKTVQLLDKSKLRIKSSSVPKNQVLINKQIMSPQITRVKADEFSIDVNDIQRTFENIKTPSYDHFKKNFKSLSREKKKNIGVNKVDIQRISTITVKSTGKPNKKNKLSSIGSGNIEEIDEMNKSSIIDDILTKDLINENSEEEKKLNDIENKMVMKYDINKSEIGITSFQQRLSEQLKLFIEFEDIINNKVTALNQDKRELVLLLEKNNEKYRYTLKKQTRLDEVKEEHYIKKAITVNVNKEHNDIIISKQNEAKKGEIDIFQPIFNKFINDEDINKFNENYENFKILLNCAKTVIDNYGGFVPLVEDFSDENKKKLKDILDSNQLKESNNVKKIEKRENRIKIIKEENEDEEEEKNEKTYKVTVANRIDKYIKEKLGKEFKKVPLKKIIKNVYQFGTQKITLKFDNNKVKVESKDGMILENFIEINGKMEELKMKKNANTNIDTNANININVNKIKITSKNSSSKKVN